MVVFFWVDLHSIFVPDYISFVQHNNKNNTAHFMFGVRSIRIHFCTCVYIYITYRILNVYIYEYWLCVCFCAELFILKICFALLFVCIHHTWWCVLCRCIGAVVTSYFFIASRLWVFSHIKKHVTIFFCRHSYMQSLLIRNVCIEIGSFSLCLSFRFKFNMAWVEWAKVPTNQKKHTHTTTNNMKIKEL